MHLLYKPKSLNLKMFQDCNLRKWVKDLVKISFLIRDKFDTFKCKAYTKVGLVNKIDKQFAKKICCEINMPKESSKHDQNKLLDSQQAHHDLKFIEHICSHDLKEPLRSISSFSQLLLRHNIGKFDEISHQFLQHIFKAANNMNDLINDVLIYSKIHTDHMENSLVELKKIVKEVIKSLHSIISNSNVKIELDDLPRVYGDKKQLNRLFYNLLDNALKFRCADEAIIKLKVYNKTQHYEFHLSDNGIGIEEEFREQIFNMGERLHSRNKYPGAGIGLAICKKIVRAHSGDIFVKSNEDNLGSTFVFTLPK